MFDLCVYHNEAEFEAAAELNEDFNFIINAKKLDLFARRMWSLGAQRYV